MVEDNFETSVRTSYCVTAIVSYCMPCIGAGFRLNDHWQFWTSAFLQGIVLVRWRTVYDYIHPLILLIFLGKNFNHHHRPHCSSVTVQLRQKRLQQRHFQAQMDKSGQFNICSAVLTINKTLMACDDAVFKNDDWKDNVWLYPTAISFILSCSTAWLNSPNMRLLKMATMTRMIPLSLWIVNKGGIFLLYLSNICPFSLPRRPIEIFLLHNFFQTEHIVIIICEIVTYLWNVPE